MRILLSNDDGIHADGIAALYNAVKDLGDIHVVAPDTQRSAVGHAITLTDPLKTYRVHLGDDHQGYAVSGTPADCVKLAVCALLDEKPDIVISGINLGPNAGIAAIYSGTVSAATEGSILGIPSMAISLGTFTDPLWDTAAHVARQLTEHLYKHPLPENMLLNVNVPNIPLEDIKGYAAAHMARSRYIETFDKRSDPRGNIYYWMDGEIDYTGDRENTDLDLMQKGYVTLTPFDFDLTNYEVLNTLREWNLPIHNTSD